MSLRLARLLLEPLGEWRERRAPDGRYAATGPSRGHLPHAAPGPFAAARLAALAGNYETAAGQVIWIGSFGEFGAPVDYLDFASGRLGALYPESTSSPGASPQ